MSDQSDNARANRHAIRCVLASSASFAVAAALVKTVAPIIPTIEIMLARSLFAFLAMLPLMIRAGGLGALRTKHPLGHLWRTLAGFAGMYGSFYGYAHLPLAMVTALGFAMPVFLGILSVPLLGERLSAGRAVSIVAGLVGVLIVLRPWRAQGALEFGPAMVVVGGVLAWAAAMVSIRRMGQAGERNITIVLWFAVATTAVSALGSIPVWVTPSPLVALLLIAIGLISGAAQLLMTEGYRSGEATMLAPFEYGAIIYTVLLGWLMWGEVPGRWEGTGMLLLIAAGLITWWRESSRRSRAATPQAPATRRRLASGVRLPSLPSRARMPD